MKQAISLLACLAFMASFTTIDAQDGRKKKKKMVEEAVEAVTTPAPKKKDSNGMKSIEDATKACHLTEGLFNIYQDTTDGKTFLEITEDQIGQEFIYFKHIRDGVSEARIMRGQYRDRRIFKIEKYYNKIELREQNTNFYFDPESPLFNSNNANINEPIVFSQKIEAMTKDTGEVATTRYLIASNDLFLSETINQVKPSSTPGASRSFNLGKLSKSKTKYKDIKNYPENTDVVVEYAFENLYPSVQGGDAITNSRYVTLEIQHSLVKVPDNDYRPRMDDSRVGYFLNKSTDLTSASATPYRDFIKRWHLVKKDPEADISEPVEPIVWWIENTTPHEIREIVMEAGMKWNEAFEKAGFKNALVIKQQPDDAEWDAGDIRYNVIRWTSSPRPPFGGYGPSFANPRTGQIIGADIMFEFVSLTNRLKQEKVFDLAGMAIDEEEQWLGEGWQDDQHICNASMYAHYENLFASYAGDALGISEAEKSELVRQALSRTVLHELGHTLGLAHNFCASQSMSMEELNDKDLTAEIGLTASVMDYHATNIALNKEDQGDYCIDQPGVYDEWAIEYGYRQFNNEEEESKGLEAILARSVEPDLCFGNDSDDMRSPGRGIDPRINVSDLSSDAIGFSIGRMELVKKTMPTLKDNLLEDGNSYHEFRNGYLVLTGNYSGALRVVTRYVGGVHIDRARVGQESGNDPLTPVAYEEQKRAMKVLEDYAFAPDAWEFDSEILNHLKMQRRGWDFRGSGEDPKVHSRVLVAQKNVLSHLLHPAVLTRLTDSGLYGNKYSVAEMMGDLSSAIFDADLYSSVNTFRQQLQLEYIYRLGRTMISSSNDYPSRSAALYQLEKIRSKVAKAKSPDESTKAHRQHVLFAIDKLLEVDN